MFEALTQPHRDPSRPWLELLEDEIEPSIVQADAPNLVIWSTLWPSRPSAQIRFELPADGAGGTDLRWILEIEAPAPDDLTVGHISKRLNQLINANLRYTFGQ